MDIRDGQGRLIAVVRNQGNQQGVYSTNGTFLGFTDFRGTFDANGRQVSTSAMPGLLIR